MKPEDIKKLRAKLDITQAELASLCGVSDRTVRKWEADGATGCAAVLLDVLKSADGGDYIEISLDIWIKNIQQGDR